MSTRSGASSPLFDAIQAGDEAALRRLLRDGTNPRIGNARETPLHAAARSAQAGLAVALIEAGALEWDVDAAGRLPLDVARENRTPARDAIVALLELKGNDDPSFRAAIVAVTTGDLPALEALLDAEPRLLRERLAGPEAYRRAERFQYFRDPKLVWFVANNPQHARRMPQNAVAIAQALIARGVERADLDYTLGLVMTSASAREHRLQIPLLQTFIAAGAKPRREDIFAAGAYAELDALRALLAGRHIEASAPVAAALGDEALLEKILPDSDANDVQAAFALAVINRHVVLAERLVRAGADVAANLVVHAHSSALHQAVANDDAAMIRMLLRHGAPRDARDTLWDATPFEWAEHLHRTAARAALAAAR